MESYEALEKAIGTNKRTVAKALGLSTSLIYKWTEPSSDWSDSGALNPLDRLEVLMMVALQSGRDPKDALAPIRYLAQKFGLILIDAPKVNESLRNIQQELMKTIKEFSDLIQEASYALEDSILTRSEKHAILKEGWELIEQVTTFIKLIENYETNK